MVKSNTLSLSKHRGLVRRWLRPSALARAAWLAVVLLHTGLVARRVACGEWGSLLDAARGVLCLGGVIYGSLKFWQIATVFDAAPRRALAFALILALGHWLLAAPAQHGAELGPAGQAVVAVLIVAPFMGAALALAQRRAALVPVRRPVALRHPAYLDADALPPAVSRHAFFLFRRPPPFSR